jgi:hypothetical protein
MDKYLSAKKLRRRWDIEKIQLFYLCKKGKLQPYNWRKEKIVTRDSYTWTKEDKELITKETKASKRISAGAEDAGTVLRVGGQYMRSEPRTDEDFEREVIKWFRPKGCEWFDYSLSKIDSVAKLKIDKFMEFDFKESDVEKYEIEHDLFKPKKDAVEIGQAPNDIIEKKILPCAPGTKWEEIKITLTDNETVRIKTPSGEERFRYNNLGMSNKKNDKPTVLWTVFIALAKNHGRVTAEDMEYHDDRERLFSASKRLNKHLQKLFGINESIFKYHYNKHKRYETKIFFSDQTVVIQEADDLERDDDGITSIIDKEIEEKKSLPSKKNKDNIYR